MHQESVGSLSYPKLAARSWIRPPGPEPHVMVYPEMRRRERSLVTPNQGDKIRTFLLQHLGTKEVTRFSVERLLRR
jgi:hypothetical protein